MGRRLFSFIHTDLDLSRLSLKCMDVQESPEAQGKLAIVFSLSLHRLQRAPRAVHRAFLSRPSLFRKHRNVKDVYHADGVSFVRDRQQTELCLVQMIAQAHRSILVVGPEPGAGSILAAALASIRSEKPHVHIREVRSEDHLLIVDEHVALIGGGDLGICVEGDIAKAVSDLYQVTIHFRRSRGRTNWPLRTRLDLEAIEVGLSRTWPSRDKATIIEIERLLIKSIRSARRFVYIESEAFTSPVIARAIAQRLRAADSPEFILILPNQKSEGLLAQMRLSLQEANLERVLQSDRYDKFRAFERPRVVLHSTGACGLTIVDDQVVTIGTAQATSKALGAAQAFDLTIEAVGRPHVVMSIARLRRERLGRLLGIEASEFDARFLLNGSLANTIESFFTPQRSLKELAPSLPVWWRVATAAFAPFMDPKRPQAVLRWLRKQLRFAPKTTLFAFILFIGFALLVMIASLFALSVL